MSAMFGVTARCMPLSPFLAVLTGATDLPRPDFRTLLGARPPQVLNRRSETSVYPAPEHFSSSSPRPSFRPCRRVLAVRQLTSRRGRGPRRPPSSPSPLRRSPGDIFVGERPGAVV